MPTQTFTSFEAFFDTIRHTVDLRAMLLGPEQGHWLLTHSILKNVSVQWGQATGKAVVEGTSMLGGPTIFLQTGGVPAFSGNGRRFDDCSLMVVGPGKEFCLAADASSRRWCSVHIAGGDLVSANGDGTSADGSTHGVLTLPSYQIGRFRSVIEQLDESVQQAPAAFESAAAQGAAHQKLVREIRNVLARPHQVGRRVGRHTVPRGPIIRTSMDFFDQHDGEYISVEQLANSAGVSERTLREAFQQYFGMPPVQYLNLRILNQVRRALKTANPLVASVTEVATRFGIWQFGRFARDYRFLFRELPSETLRNLR